MMEQNAFGGPPRISEIIDSVKSSTPSTLATGILNLLENSIEYDALSKARAGTGEERAIEEG